MHTQYFRKFSLIQREFPEVINLKRKKEINECEAGALTNQLTLKSNTVARRFRYDLSIWPELYQLNGREDKPFGCWPTFSCQSCSVCEISWNKIGRITFIRNNGVNNHKLHVGWRADENQYNSLKLSAYFHEVIDDKKEDQYPEYWVSHYIRNVPVNSQIYVDMYMSLGTIALILGQEAVVIRKPGMILSNKPSYLSRTFYFGGECTAPNDMAVLFTDQDHDNPNFGNVFNSRDYMTWNATEFETGDEAEFFAYNTINGSSPLDKVNSSLTCYPEQYCVIGDGSDITFVAGGKVKLYPGFHAESGSHFRAIIEQKKKPDSLLSSLKKLNLPALDSVKIDSLKTSGYFIAKESDEVITDSKISTKTSNILLFPNPNQGHFIINIEDNDITKYSVVITNSIGEVIFYTCDITNEYFPIDISKHSKGLYFLKVTSDSSIWTEKIVIH